MNTGWMGEKQPDTIGDKSSKSVETSIRKAQR
jgi:hypothetical protein